MAIVVETKHEAIRSARRARMAARLTGIGGPEMLVVGEETVPEPGPGEVLVKVLASGVAFADVLCRRGSYPLMPKLPFTPGYDLVGLVEQLGAGTAALHENQVVAALLPKFGANATHVCLPEALFVPLPDGVDAVRGTAVILNYLTAYGLLVDKAAAQPGERVLVHSAAGGVGTALLQLGRCLDLEMVGTASTDKLPLVSAEGAVAIDYRRQDFAAAVRKLYPDGIDIVCDPVGGETMARSYGLLRKKGRLLSYGMLSAKDSGKIGVLPTLARLGWYRVKPDGKRATFYGSTPTMAQKDTAWYRESMAALFVMLAAGQIDPVIGAELPLAEIALAQEMLERGEVRGKIVLLS